MYWQITCHIYFSYKCDLTVKPRIKYTIKFTERNRGQKEGFPDKREVFYLGNIKGSRQGIKTFCNTEYFRNKF